MSDAINAMGSQGSSTSAAALSALQATTTTATTTTATLATAETKAVQAAARTSEAASLELSETSAKGTSQEAPNLVMTMEEAAEAFQNYLSNLPSNLQFQPDYQAGLLIFKVVNPVTQKVIRQLPPEEVVNQARYLRNAAKQEHSGILLDDSL